MRRMYTTQGIQKLIDESIENNEIIDKFEYNETDNQLESSKKIVAPEFYGDNAKPLYYHPIYAASYDAEFMLTCVIINNDSTPFTWATFKAFLESHTSYSLCPVSGNIKFGNNHYLISRVAIESNTNVWLYGFNVENSEIQNAVNIKTLWDALDFSLNAQFTDSINKLN